MKMSDFDVKDVIANPPVIKLRESFIDKDQWRYLAFQYDVLFKPADTKQGLIGETRSRVRPYSR